MKKVISILMLVLIMASVMCTTVFAGSCDWSFVRQKSEYCATPECPIGSGNGTRYLVEIYARSCNSHYETQEIVRTFGCCPPAK